MATSLGWLADEVVSFEECIAPDSKERAYFWERVLSPAVCLWTELCYCLRDREGFKKRRWGRGVKDGAVLCLLVLEKDLVF